MKKFLLTISLCFMLSFSIVQAQCTPDPNFTTILAFSPSPIPSGTVGQAYSQVVTFVFPNDTLVFGFPADFTEHEITTLTNIPAGMTYQCNLSNCLYPVTQGQITRGCMTISGTPTAVVDTTQDSIEICVRSRISTFIGSIDTVNCFWLKIAVDSPSVSLDPRWMEAFDMEVFPNPATLSSNLRLNIPGNVDARIVMQDVMGREVEQIHEGTLSRGEYNFGLFGNTGRFSPGIYVVRVIFNGGEEVLARKVILTAQ